MTGIHPNDISKFWGSIENAIIQGDKKAEFIERYPLDYIQRQLENADWQVYIHDKTLFLTCITVYPSGFKSLDILLVVGDDMKLWSESVWNAFKRWAKDLRCKEIDFQGRKGWSKYGKKYEPDLKTWYRYRVKI